MIEPTNKALLQQILEQHLGHLTVNDKRQMLAEVFTALRPHTADANSPQEEQLAQVVYSCHLFLKIFDDLYDVAEAQVNKAQFLSRCLENS